MTTTTAPAPISDLSVVPDGSGGFNLAWTNPAGTVEDVVLRNGIVLATSTSPIGTYHDTTPPPGSNTYTVEPVEPGPPSNAVTVTSGGPDFTTPPAAPVVTITQSGTSLVIKWVNPAQASGFGSPLGNNVYLDGKKIWVGGWPAPAPTSYTWSGLVVGSSHTVQVDAYNSGGEGLKSALVTEVIGGTPPPPPPPPPPPTGSVNGLFLNSQKQSDVLAAAASLGVHITAISAFCNGTASTTPPSQVGSGGLRILCGVGALTDAQAIALAQWAVANGHADMMWRVMWEQNQNVGGWFSSWNEKAFPVAVDYQHRFQSIVTAARSVPGQKFTFIWNPDSGNWSGNQNPGRSNEDTYPGNPYVDWIGIDAYDNGSIQANVNRWIAFAAAQGKPVCFPEWGLNGKDNPGFIDFVFGLPKVMQAYFEFKGSINSWLPDFPNAKAQYTKDFSTLALTPGVMDQLPAHLDTVSTIPQAIIDAWDVRAAAYAAMP